uniref:Uncharacterized protein n=1 Tax=Pantoea phage Survivor TaxID=3232176 RepID=A0AAU8KXY2_9CAUD
MPIIDTNKKKTGGAKRALKWFAIILVVLFVLRACTVGDHKAADTDVDVSPAIPENTSLFTIGNMDGIHVETLCKNPGKPEGVNFVIKDGQGNVLNDYKLFMLLDLDGNSPITTKGWKEIKIHAPGQMTMTEAFFLTAFGMKDALDVEGPKFKFAITKGYPAAGDDVWVEPSKRVILYGAIFNTSKCSTLSK